MNQIKLFYIFSFLLFMSSLHSCRKKNTEWNSDWVLPLAKDTINLSNYHNDSTLDASGDQYVVDFKRTILDAYISDYLELPDTTIHQSYSPSIGIGNIPAGFTFYNSVETHDLSISDVELKKAIVSSGNIKLSVYNPISTSAFYTISMPGVTIDGVDFEQTFFVGAGTQENPTEGEALISLDGYELDLQGTGVMGSSNISAFNILQTSFSIMTDPEGESSSLSTSDVFEFDAKFENIKIAYAQGYFGALSFSDTADVSIPYLDHILSGSISLSDIPLTFSISNGAKIPASSTLTLLENTNANQNTVALLSSQLNTEQFIAPAIGSWSSLSPSLSTITFNSDNSNLNSYIENLGHTHHIGYNIKMNPLGPTTGSYNEIFPNSKVKVDLASQFPLALGVDGLIFSDTLAFSLNTIQLNNLISAEAIELHIRSLNAFPLQGGISLEFLDDGLNILQSIPTELILLSSVDGMLDPIDNLYKASNKAVLSLDNGLVENLLDTRSIVIKAHMQTSNVNELTPVSIPSDAFLYFESFLKITTKNILP
ncbi:MAG: hypothetical protein ISP69_03880 [Crocinitomicaceae bacterium]|nr:hypothetical protein [Crocinitomicaceae bacterium]